VLALQELAEKDLASQIPAVAARVQALRPQKKYTEALQDISKLRPYVDTFFDKVMVIGGGRATAGHRLALLHTLLREFSTIADFSEIGDRSETLNLELESISPLRPAQ